MPNVILAQDKTGVRFKETRLTIYHMLGYCFNSTFRLLTVFAKQKTDADIQARPVSIWSPLVWLDRTIHEHYWISTGWTNRPDGVGSAGGRSQTAGKSIRTGDLWNIGKAAVLCWWLKVFVNIQAHKSVLHPVVNLNSQPTSKLRWNNWSRGWEKEIF